MIVLKYCKKDSARFISHIDLLRHASRILRRAEIPIKFSQGFNPHALVFFSPPLAVGVESVAEYIAIDTEMSADEVFKRYNESVSHDFQSVAVYECAKNPNLQGKITASDYVFNMPFTNINLKDGFEIEYEKKGKNIIEDVADRIFDVFEHDGKLAMRLASGNVNLRPDRVLFALNKMFGSSLCVSDVIKTAQYVFEDGKFVNADEYLSR